jgi:ATP-binding cassette subfamily C (CFTR/MRP) protein 1
LYSNVAFVAHNYVVLSYKRNINVQYIFFIQRRLPYKIWQALQSVHLRDSVEQLPQKLETGIVESGGNFSTGQRQLFCLARALLKKSKILVLDEATASVDFETDAVIQGTIRKEFKECTVLTIAHRINTILDSDRVMVMDHGQAAEFDSPASLLANPDSKFSELVRHYEASHQDKK